MSKRTFSEILDKSNKIKSTSKKNKIIEKLDKLNSLNDIENDLIYWTTFQNNNDFKKIIYNENKIYQHVTNVIESETNEKINNVQEISLIYPFNICTKWLIQDNPNLIFKIFKNVLVSIQKLIDNSDLIMMNLTPDNIFFKVSIKDDKLYMYPFINYISAENIVCKEYVLVDWIEYAPKWENLQKTGKKLMYLPYEINAILQYTKDLNEHDRTKTSKNLLIAMSNNVLELLDSEELTKEQAELIHPFYVYYPEKKERDRLNQIVQDINKSKNILIDVCTLSVTKAEMNFPETQKSNILLTQISNIFLKVICDIQDENVYANFCSILTKISDPDVEKRISVKKAIELSNNFSNNKFKEIMLNNKNILELLYINFEEIS